MTYILAFFFCGVVCAISQFIFEKTKLTPGHINTILVIVGCVLSGFKIYDGFVETFSAGATVPIINFGHLLVSGASEGYMDAGIIGLFKGIFTNSGAGISFTIVCALIISVLFKVKH